MLARRIVVACSLMSCLDGAHAASTTRASDADLATMSLEELMNVEVTSVSKRPERLSAAAASIFVISGEDIRRSGATTLPEVLRLAPNLQVAQGHASGYAINARGLNNTAANKLLVLIDGRSVYTSLFSGVFWDVQDVVLEDVERIEVISGPGGTLWGTNAVNGVINVITRSSKDTQGGLAAGGAGNREFGATVRYGGTLGADGSYRVYGKHLDHDGTSTASGAGKSDAWHKSQGGFRADWGGARDQFTVQGDAYQGSIGQPLPGTVSITGVTLALDTISVSGANLLGRWARNLEGGSSLSVQAYFDRTERTVPPTFGEALNTYDLQLQHSLRPLGMHTVTWGAQYRYAMDRVANSAILAFLPARQNQTWLSLFAQDEMALRDDLRLTLGLRIERNDYTGYEFLPSARLAWTVAQDHLLWTAATRTVRAPSRLDRDTFVPATAPFLLAGGPDVRSEIANVYEIGYRGRPADKLSYSVTAYHADYDHLRTQEIAPGGASLIFGSGMEGMTGGVEMWGTYQVSRTWRLRGGLTVLNEKLRLKPGSNDVTAPRAQEGLDPERTWIFASSHDLPHRTEFDVRVRHVSELPSVALPAYTAVDIRLGWRVRPDLEFSVSGQNLFGSGHAEFTDPVNRTEFQRAVFFKVLSRF
ncbi:MAG: TonB-dependent receptor [Betaproteobacteria bacterium]|nr:TonB-dependent receptor [Betaproteobacteria bacterium]